MAHAAERFDAMRNRLAAQAQNLICNPRWRHKEPTPSEMSRRSVTLGSSN